jgi:hypothetical protein
MVAAFDTEFGEPPASSRATGKRPFARWKLDQQTVLVTVEAVGERRVKVSAAHDRLPDSDATGPAKDRLIRVLRGLAS